MACWLSGFSSSFCLSSLVVILVILISLFLPLFGIMYDSLSKSLVVERSVALCPTCGVVSSLGWKVTPEGPRSSWTRVRSPGWRVVLRGCPWPAAPVPAGVPAIQSLECGVWVLGGLADGESSIHAGLCWGLPRLGGRGCRCPPTEGPVAQLGVGHVLGICRCSSLQWGRESPAVPLG